MKRVYILSLFLALLISSVNSIAQDTKQPAPLYPSGSEKKESPKTEKAKPKTDKPKPQEAKTEKAAPVTGKVKAGFGVSVVQTKAEFPGGEDSLATFVRRNMSYPKKSREIGAEGDVYVGFMITKEGKITDVRVLSSINDELDAEAIRVVKLMPDWKPAMAGGSPVDVQYILPFSFILPKKL